jgi:dihydropteroate synthase
VGSFPDFVDLVCRERGAALMGIVNVTPDSFFDGGKYVEGEPQERRIDKLLAEGADIVDIGAESTRPGAEPIDADVQIARAEAALVHALGSGAMVSIDTTSPKVARWALGQGAHLVNDVSCLSDPELAAAVAEHDACLLLMHSRYPTAGMLGFGAYPEDGYEDVVGDVAREWEEARTRAVEEGVSPGRVFFDPGLGFHKSARHSLELLRRLREFSGLLAPICVGPSRKSFIGALDGSGPEDRLGGTIIACLAAVAGGARILRVHDVAAVKQALVVQQALDGAPIGQDDRQPLWRTEREALDA